MLFPVDKKEGVRRTYLSLYMQEVLMLQLILELSILLQAPDGKQVYLHLRFLHRLDMHILDRYLQWRTFWQG